MKKSFKFSAILLALITSASGLAPVGAIPPVKPNAESKEKTTEKPQKRAREDENSKEAVPEKRFKREEEVIPQTPCAKAAAAVSPAKAAAVPPAQAAAVPSAQAAAVPPAQAAAAPAKVAVAIVPSKQEGELSEEEEKKYREISSQLYDFQKKHTKIIDEELYTFNLASFLLPGRTYKIHFRFSNRYVFNLRKIRDKYYQNTDVFSSDIEKCSATMDRELFHLIDIKQNQLTALSLFTMIHYYIMEENRNLINNGSDRNLSRIAYLLAISKFNKNAASELGTDVPPEEFHFDAADIHYDTSNMTMKISFYSGTQKVYESIL